MGALAGRKAVVKACTTSGGSFAVVKGIKTASLNIDGQEIDVSELGDDWKKKLRGILDAGIELSGNYDPADTTGQGVIKSAFLNDTDLFLEILPDGVTGFKMQVQVTKFAVDVGVDKEVGLSISASQTAGVTEI